MLIEHAKILESLPPISTHNIPGNASTATKGRVATWLYALSNTGFGTRTTKALKLVDVSILPKVDEPLRQEARVVLEMTVTDEMLDLGGKLHEACITHLVDICSTFPVVALSHAQGGAGSPGVSQNINTVFHAATGLGDKLKLVTTSKTVGPHVSSAQIDIWDTTHHRLVASATQVKMEGSASKL
ncbi:hypothetical protein J3A83DRAFT_2194478 [Scleroderma citrinum]